MTVQVDRNVAEPVFGNGTTNTVYILDTALLGALTDSSGGPEVCVSHQNL